MLAGPSFLRVIHNPNLLPQLLNTLTKHLLLVLQ